jgi:Fe-S cluster assembly protein SufD
MSIERFTGVDGFLARYRGLRDRLPGDVAARDAAAEAFQRLGFPGRRDEAWKYTNVRPLADAAFHEPLSTVEDNAYLAGVPRVAESRLVFVDGRYRPDLSDAAPTWFRSFQDQPRFGALARADR